MVYGEGDSGKMNLTEASPARFPQLRASNLENREFDLPKDFAGERNLLLIAFQREQQQELDTWLREMRRFQEADPGFQYYELPTIERLNALARWFIDSGMRRGTPKADYDHVITVYADTKAWKEGVRYTDPDAAYLILLDRESKVDWHYRGTFDETLFQALCSRVSDLTIAK